MEQHTKLKITNALQPRLCGIISLPPKGVLRSLSSQSLGKCWQLNQ